MLITLGHHICMHVYLFHIVAVGTRYKLYRSSTFPLLLGVTNCIGSEEHLIDCPHSGIGDNASCIYHNIVSEVYCSGKI